MESAKTVIRIRMKKNREEYFKTLSESARQSLNKKLVANILTLIPANGTGAVAGFWPLATEPDIRPVLEEMHHQGRKVLLPVTQGVGSPLIFRTWRPGDKLREGPFKTLEPISSLLSEEPEVIIVPVLGFDGRGHRLGYGVGHYDRTIAQLRKKEVAFLTIGVAFEMQRVNELPIAAYDQPLNWVVTEEKIQKYC